MNIVMQKDKVVNVPGYIAPSRRFGWCRDAEGNPVAKRVVLIDNLTGSFIGSTLSRASDGYWTITGIRSTELNTFICEIAIDDTMTYESVVRNHKSLVE